MPTEQDLFFESQYQKNFGKLKTIAFSELRNMPVAEELVQETFLIALKDYETFCQRENPLAYLKKILRYKILEYKREKKRYLKIFLSMDYEFLSKVKAPSPPSPISTSGILETVRETLTDEEWYILRKFAIDGASHLQIAKELGITVSASQKRLERIRKKLENSLPEY